MMSESWMKSQLQAFEAFEIVRERDNNVAKTDSCWFSCLDRKHKNKRRKLINSLLNELAILDSAQNVIWIVLYCASITQRSRNAQIAACGFSLAFQHRQHSRQSARCPIHWLVCVALRFVAKRNCNSCQNGLLFDGYWIERLIQWRWFWISREFSSNSAESRIVAYSSWNEE